MVKTNFFSNSFIFLLCFATTISCSNASGANATADSAKNNTNHGPAQGAPTPNSTAPTPTQPPPTPAQTPASQTPPQTPSNASGSVTTAATPSATPSVSPSPSPAVNAPTPTPVPTPAPLQKILTETDLKLYVKQGDVLIPKLTIPAGTLLAIPEDYSLTNADFTDANGVVTRSSTGFIYPVQVVSWPIANTGSPEADPTDITAAAPAIQNYDEAKATLATLNSTAEVLFVDGTIIDSLQGTTGNFQPLPSNTAPGSGFLAHYEASGRPRFTFIKSVTKRFGVKVNLGVLPSELSEEKREKWQKIYAQLVKLADRTAESPKAILMMNRTAARRWSESFDATGAIAQNGIWSIAIQTSQRHGFENTPCAEFMSEILRQSYIKAGYQSSEDFNTARGNELNWKNTAAVIRFSRALVDGGWIPWTTDQYKPPVGAFLFAEAGGSPGHTYIAAGADGLLIIDNGSPQGRDLRLAPEATIEMMYKTGLFFLPPGISPEPQAPPAPPTPPTPAPQPLPGASPAPTGAASPEAAPADPKPIVTVAPAISPKLAHQKADLKKPLPIPEPRPKPLPNRVDHKVPAKLNVRLKPKPKPKPPPPQNLAPNQTLVAKVHLKAAAKL